MESRVRELERLLNQAMRRIESQETRLAAAESWQSQMSSTLGRGASGGGGSIRVGRVTATVTASTGATPGAGTVQLLKLDGGDYVDDGSPVSVKNAGAAIASPKRCFVLTDPAGGRWATPEEC